MNGASNINALAAKLNTKVDTASQVNFTSASIAKLGNEPSVIAAIALSPKGALSKPIKGNQGVYFINVTETVPNISKYDEKNTILQLTTRELYSVYRSLDALMDKYEVKDNRKNFY